MEQLVTSIPPGNCFHVHISNRFLPPATKDPLNFRVPEFATMIPIGKSFRCYVHTVLFRNYIPTIRTGVNDSFTYKVNGIIYNLIIEAGVYSALQLEALLAADLQLINAGFNVIYNTDSKRMNFVIPNGFTFSIPYSENIDENYNIVVADPAYRFLETIGFLNNVNENYTNTTIIGKDPVNLFGCDYMKINFDNWNLHMMNSNPRNPQTIATIPLKEEYGELIHFSPPFPSAFETSASDLEYININCTDQYGYFIRDIPFAATLEIHMILIPL